MNPLAYLTLSSRVGPEDLRSACVELAAVGVSVQADDLRALLAQARADRNPMTGEWRVPNATPPAWGYDELQDAIRARTGLRGPALFAAWQKVKGHLRLRFAAGNTARPADHVAARWATA